MAPEVSSSAEDAPETLPFRSADALYAAYKRFEQDWVDWKEADMRVDAERPANFPPVFASRWALAWHLRMLSDDEVLRLQRTWDRHPGSLRAEEKTGKVHADVREQFQSTLTPEDVKAAGFPRLWEEAA